MRENMGLYRGKRLDNGEWIKGFYVCISGRHHYIFAGEKDTTGLYPTFVYHEVDPETVGQYIGVKDAKGKEICENDLVAYMWGTNRVTMRIVYANGEFLMRPAKKYGFKTWDLRVAGMGQEMEIVNGILL